MYTLICTRERRPSCNTRHLPVKVAFLFYFLITNDVIKAHDVITIACLYLKCHATPLIQNDNLFYFSFICENGFNLFDSEPLATLSFKISWLRFKIRKQWLCKISSRISNAMFDDQTSRWSIGRKFCKVISMQDMEQLGSAMTSFAFFDDLYSSRVIFGREKWFGFDSNHVYVNDSTRISSQWLES